MNDGTDVSIWQDADMTSSGAPRPTPIPVREVADVETLKALSDPTRVAILDALMSGTRAHPRVMSAKELADELNEPQTKLYRHIKQLEARHLIQVAETRLVSGIVEHRYQTGQLALDISRTFLGSQTTDDTTKAFTAIIDTFRAEFIDAIQTGKVQFKSEVTSENSYRNPVINGSIVTISPEKANEFRARLATLVDELQDTEESETGVPIRLLTVFYSPE